jgi:isoleucyl-tRNA synthetase
MKACICRTSWRLRELRRAITGALEIEREKKVIGSSLEAAAVLQLTDPSDLGLFDAIDLAEIAITSQARVEALVAPVSDAPPGYAAVQIAKAEGEKCARCWRVLPEVATHADHICDRCTGAVHGATA